MSCATRETVKMRVIR